RRVGLQATLVTAQALFDTLCRGIKRQLRILCLTGSLKRHAAIKANEAIRTEARARLFDSDVTGKPAIEILLDGLANTPLDLCPEGVADFHLLTRDTQAHDETDLLYADSDRCEFIPVVRAHKV